MTQWFSTMFGLNQAQTKPQAQSIEKPQIIDDQVMQSMDSSLSNNKPNQKQQQMPQQLQSQSSSSSGFQQFIIQDGQSPTIPTPQVIQKPNIQKSNQKFDNLEIDMYRTINFDEDLNQSVSDNAYKNVKKSNFPEKDLMSFSGISANGQSFSDLNSGKKQMQQSFSNVNSSFKDKNLESFSQLDGQFAKSNDLVMISQKPEHDSDKEDEEENKMEQSKSSTKDKVNDYLSVWQIPPRKTSDTEKDTKQKVQIKNSESFSQLDDGHEVGSKENLGEIEYKLMQWSQDGYKKQDLIDLSDLEKSVVAPSIQPIGNKKESSPSKDAFMKSPNKIKKLITPQRSSQQPKCIPQVINMGESFVMSPVLQKPNKKSSNKDVCDTKNKQQNISAFKIHSKDYVHFIRYGKTQDRLLSQKLLQSITEFFLIQNIMLPIFNIRLIQDIENEMELERKEVKLSLFTFCINLYFDLLDNKYPQEMKKFFESQQASKSMKSQVGTNAKKEDNSVFLGNFSKKVFDYFKMNHYSKAQILKKTLQTQLAFVTQYKQSWLQSWQDTEVDQQLQQLQQQDQLSKRNSMQMQNVKQKQGYLLKKIADLEVLISFQKSEMYCEQKLKEKMEENIWKERKRKLIQDRNFFITHLYGSCFI